MNTSIQIDKETHKKLKIISTLTDKKLYELIDEAAELLKIKYNISYTSENHLHE